MKNINSRVLKCTIQTILFVVGFFLVMEIFPMIAKGNGLIISVKSVMRYLVLALIYFFLIFLIDKVSSNKNK